MRHKPPGRWVIACINWSAPPEVNKAALFRVGADGSYDVEIYLPTWQDAIDRCEFYRKRAARVTSRLVDDDPFATINRVPRF